MNIGLFKPASFLGSYPFDNDADDFERPMILILGLLFFIIYL